MFKVLKSSLPLFLVFVHGDATWPKGDNHKQATNHGQGLQQKRIKIINRNTNFRARHALIDKIKRY